MEAIGFMERLWDVGQRHLAAGRYVAARRDLSAAEGVAWRRGDAGALARIYLPLLEARRQIRYLAVEGRIVIAGAGEGRAARMEGAGTFLFVGDGARGAERAVAAARGVAAAGIRGGSCVEALVILSHGADRRLVSAAEPVFADGVAVMVGAAGTASASTDADFVAWLPGAGVYDGQAAGAGEGARESLLIAWEALGLKWQRRHAVWRGRPGKSPMAAAWVELEWLRRALRIDPASEPITMRLISLAESIAQKG